MNLKKLSGCKPKPPEYRFHKSYIVQENNCWVWQGRNRGSNNYGSINVNGKIKPAHRYSWELHNGEIPRGILVCHKCDTPKCVNPEHLFLGTSKDNSIDMIKKGRSTKGIKRPHAGVNMRGSKNHNNKITEEEVIKIFKEDGRYLDIAKKYGISHSSVSAIKNKRNWKYLTKDL